MIDQAKLINQPKHAVRVVLSREWAQAVTRAQQLHNAGRMVKISRNATGKINVEPIEVERPAA